MKKTILAVITLVFAFGFPTYASGMVGGWSVTNNIIITEEAKEAFDNATKEVEDVSYDAVALLGTQVVNGTNYCFLCRVTDSAANETDGYCFVYIYEDLQGNSMIAGTQDYVMEMPATLAETAEDTSPSATTISEPTMGEKNALSNAHQYLDFTAFSYTGLIEQLEYEGYSHEEAVYGADNCGADWNEQAAKCAENYLNYTSFSRSGLIEQLEYEGFTAEQAEYGVTAVGY